MKKFRTDKSIFWTSQLKDWFWTFLTIAIFYIGLRVLFQMTHDNLVLFVMVMLSLKIGDTLTQYHVIEIEIDKDRNHLIFKLRSIMSGEKTKQYKLENVTSEFKKNSGIAKFFIYPYRLRIFLAPKDTFCLTNRYGFSFDTLAAVDKIIKERIG